MIEVSEIKTIQVESYIDTLRDIPVGANRVYLLIGTVYTGFHNAKTRLSKQNLQFVFRRFSEENKQFLEEKRLK